MEELSGVGTSFSQNSWPYLVLKFPRDSYIMLVFHCSWLTPTQYLFFIGHSLHPHNACFSLPKPYIHAMLVFYWPWFTPTQCLLFIFHAFYPCNACFSLAMVYTHAMLALHWSQFTPMHSLFRVIILLFLSMARHMCQQHPPGSLQVNVIYYRLVLWHINHCR